MTEPTFKRSVIVFLASGCGIGFAPYFPGTLGTLIAIPLALVLNRFAAVHLTASAAALTGLIVFAIWVSQMAANILQAKDPQIIVIDEIAGFAVAAFLTETLSGLILAFVLFRFFDIAKVFPASKLEQLPGGAGIVLDDIMAGIYTFLILRLSSHAGLI
jgi:phosphatidylglycerophosphatase A